MHPATRFRTPAHKPARISPHKPGRTPGSTSAGSPGTTPVRPSGRGRPSAGRLPATEPALATVIPLFRTGPVEGPALPPAPRTPGPRARRTEGEVAVAAALGLACGAATVQLARLAVALQPPVATAALAVGVFALGALAVQGAATGSPRRRLAFLAAALVALPLTTAVDGVRWSPAGAAGYALAAGASLATAAYACSSRSGLSRPTRPVLQVVRSR